MSDPAPALGVADVDPVARARAMFASLFAPKYRYARELPVVDHALGVDQVVAALREQLSYEAHNHRFFRARSQALAAEVAALSAQVADLRARLALAEAADAALDVVPA
jgi:hypothetical protein